MFVATSQSVDALKGRSASLPGGLPRGSTKLTAGRRSELYSQVFEAIKYGFSDFHKEPGQHILSSAIEERLGIPGTLVREAVHFLRTHEHPEIGADSRGYYVAENMDAYDADLRQLVSRRDSLNQLIEAKQAHRVEFAEMLGPRKGAKAREEEEARFTRPTEWQEWQEKHKPKLEGEKQAELFGEA